MNIQEVIRKMYEEGLNCKPLKCASQYDKGYGNGIAFAINLLDKLDEPEKPVVPQFVADWYEENKDDFEYNLYRLCIDFYEQKLHEDLREWFGNDKNKPIEVLVLMNKYGYEVEKEKLYKVSLKKNGIGIGVQQQDGSFKERFAKEELKEYGFDNLDEYETEEVEE
ncbi:DUF1642 domain-containing protein [Streptococcus gallolyticus subsp. gallolyticus]|uniref:DUF1642 domain-containing protein n=1 Tax=Streptococcus gallolyticus TaxID=315405 RepID=UPI002283EFC4|nr:DUF1642 domain-containing protein [Streptococcus gallolyticus]MCY7171767.1 DUF1642 domain-containing protein [Streptococcus gallolyticus subsp. gallolyticus]